MLLTLMKYKKIGGYGENEGGLKMAGIMNKETNSAINLDYIVRMVASNDENIQYEYFSESHEKEWIVFGVASNDDHIFLNAFDTQEEATKLIIDLARWQETGQPPKEFYEKE